MDKLSVLLGAHVRSLEGLRVVMEKQISLISQTEFALEDFESLERQRASILASVQWFGTRIDQVLAATTPEELSNLRADKEVEVRLQLRSETADQVIALNERLQNLVLNSMADVRSALQKSIQGRHQIGRFRSHWTTTAGNEVDEQR